MVAILPLKYNDLDWYEPNEAFFLLLSNPKNLRRQNGDFLEFTDLSGNVILSIQVMFKINDKTNFNFIIQNQDIFEKEQVYLRTLNKSLSVESVQALLSQPITNIEKEYMYNFLYRVFKDLNSNTIYGNVIIPSHIMQEIKTVKDMAIKIANIIIFLDIDNISTSIFKKRIIKNYYNPSVLFELKFDDKFPEFKNHTDSTEDNLLNIKTYIEKKIKKENFSISESMIKV